MGKGSVWKIGGGGGVKIAFFQSVSGSSTVIITGLQNEETYLITASIGYSSGDSYADTCAWILRNSALEQIQFGNVYQITARLEGNSVKCTQNFGYVIRANAYKIG